MSGPNTKANKVDRALRRIVEISDQSATIEQLSNSLHLAAETAYRLEQENARLRKYLGSVLFARRKLQALAAIPTLNRTNAEIADFADNKGDSSLPHAGAGTV